MVRVSVSCEYQRATVLQRPGIGIGFLGLLLLSATFGTGLLGRAGIAGGIGVALGNAVLALWGLKKNGWYYLIDEKGVHLIMPTRKTLLLNWQRTAPVTYEFERWSDQPTLDLVTTDGKRVRLVFAPSEQDKIMNEALPLLDRHVVTAANPLASH